MSYCLRNLIGQLSLLLVSNMVLSKMNNREHQTKQTYESYTFQPLMGFWLKPYGSLTHGAVDGFFSR